MPRQPIFGAPPPSDPSGGFYGTVKAAGDAAQMQVSATQAAAQMVVQALSNAVEVANRRDMQKREIRASRQLETMRQLGENQRSAASRASAEGIAARSQEGETSREKMRLDAQREESDRAQKNWQAEFGARRDEFRQTNDIARANLRISRATERRQQEESAQRLAEAGRAHRQNLQADFGRSLLPLALSMAPYEPGAVPGTLAVKPDFPRSFSGMGGAMQAAGQAMGGPGGAAMQVVGRAMRQPGVMSSLSEQLGSNVESRNKLAVQQEENVSAERRTGMQNTGSNVTVQGLMPMRQASLEMLRDKVASGRDRQVIESAITSLSAGDSILYDPSAGKFQVNSAMPNREEIESTLDRIANSAPGVYDMLLGSSAFPVDTPERQRGYGASIRAQRGQGAPPEQSQPAPATNTRTSAQPEMPQRPAPVQPTQDKSRDIRVSGGYEDAGVTVPVSGSQAAGDYAASQTSAALGSQIRREETYSRDGRNKFKARVGAEQRPPPGGPQPSPLSAAAPQSVAPRGGQNRGPSDTVPQGGGSSTARGTYHDGPLPDPDAMAYRDRQGKITAAYKLANELTKGQHFAANKERLMAALRANDYRVKELAQLALDAGELTQQEYDSAIASHAQRSNSADRRERRR